MIKVEVVSNESFINKVNVLGHAMYDDYGKDIVCSAVSSIVITTVNGIIKLDKDAIRYKQDSKGLYIEVLKNDNIINTLMCNMIDLLKELENDYPKNIIVK